MTYIVCYTTPTVGVPCIVPYCVYCVLYWSSTRGDMTYSMYYYVRLLLWGYGRGECSYCICDWSSTRGDMTY